MARAGKKRRTGKREPNGRLSRQPKHVADRERTEAQRNLTNLDAEQRSILSVGLEARERVFGVKPAQSRDQMAGSVIGRWCLQGIVTRPQYDAAMAFLESHARNLLAIDAPRQPGAVDLNATHGRPVSIENVDQLRKWRIAHRDAVSAVQAKQNEVRLQGNLLGALSAVVLRDTEIEHLAGDVRTALNALVRFYGLMAREAA